MNIDINTTLLFSSWENPACIMNDERLLQVQCTVRANSNAEWSTPLHNEQYDPHPTLPKNGGSLEVRQQSVPPQLWIYGDLSPKGFVVLLPATATMSQSFTNDQAHVCKHISGGRVRRPDSKKHHEAEHP